MTEFENKLLEFGYKAITAKELEAWVYSHPDLGEELGSDLHFELLSADFDDPTSVIDVMNPWFQQRFPEVHGDFDLRTIFLLQHSKRGLDYIKRSIERYERARTSG